MSAVVPVEHATEGRHSPQVATARAVVAKVSETVLLSNSVRMEYKKERTRLLYSYYTVEHKNTFSPHEQVFIVFSWKAKPAYQLQPLFLPPFGTNQQKHYEQK